MPKPGYSPAVVVSPYKLRVACQDSLTAKVRKEDVNYYTEALKTVDVNIKNTFEEKQNGVAVALGELAITETYREYVVKTNDEVIDRKPLHLPPLTFSIVGIWFKIPAEVEEEIEKK
jgi:ATP-dependent helicase YprA (DUF1998 family)